jgi:hypothetical protein
MLLHDGYVPPFLLVHVIKLFLFLKWILLELYIHDERSMHLNFQRSRGIDVLTVGVSHWFGSSITVHTRRARQ